MNRSRTLPAWSLKAALVTTFATLFLSVSRAGDTPKAAPGPLRVAAASDLQSALPVLAKAFTDQTGIEVIPNFGASGQLAEQIKAGAPIDVFLSANRKFVDDLAEGGFSRRESVQPYAIGRLVLAVRRESVDVVKSLADLSKPEIKKVALANPRLAPYGAAGKQALERAGQWATVSPKIVQSETVRQALQFVQSGNAEAGLVSAAIVNVPGVTILDVDPSLYDPIVQALGIVSRSRQPEAASAFRRFVLGDQGQALLRKFGFSKYDSSTTTR